GLRNLKVMNPVQVEVQVVRKARGRQDFQEERIAKLRGVGNRLDAQLIIILRDGLRVSVAGAMNDLQFHSRAHQRWLSGTERQDGPHLLLLLLLLLDFLRGDTERLENVSGKEGLADRIEFLLQGIQILMKAFGKDVIDAAELNLREQAPGKLFGWIGEAARRHAGNAAQGRIKRRQ